MRPPDGQRGLRGRRAGLPGRPLPARRALIAILGDTHLPRGSRRLPDACVEILRRASLVIHTGDVAGAAALAELRALATRVEAVHGNVDDPELVEELPERLVVEWEGERIGVVHDAGAATGRHARLREWFPDCGLLAYGHTHVPEVAQYRGAWIVNPGSPTERRRTPLHTMAVVEEGVPRLVTLS